MSMKPCSLPCLFFLGLLYSLQVAAVDTLLIEDHPTTSSPIKHTLSSVPTESVNLNDEEKKWLQDNQKITFTGDPNWLPFEAFNDKGEYIGIVSDYLKALEKMLQIHITPIKVESWLETLNRSQDGTIDIISGDVDDLVLKQNYLPITPYLKTPIVIVMRDDNSFINDIDEIADQRIALIDGYGYTSKLFKNYPGQHFIKAKDAETALAALSISQYDAVILSMPKAGYLINTKGLNNLKIVGKTSIEMQVTLFIHKRKPMLHTLIDKAMQKLPHTIHSTILKDWMEVQFAKKIDYLLMLKIVSVFFAILLMGLYFHRKTESAKREAEYQHARFEDVSKQLSKYLSPQIYDLIFNNTNEVRLASKRKKLTIFFSDIAGFTHLTEKLEAEELTDLLNYYLTEMTQIALQYGGTIDKYIGDAILIFFGDPESRGYKEDALQCVKMATEMQQKLSEIRGNLIDQGVADEFNIRIGINTGYCTVGNFGSTNRMDYTVVGNAVNIASRLESSASLNHIHIAHETWSLVKDEVACIKQKPIMVKGISLPLQTYQVMRVGSENEGNLAININGLRLELQANMVEDKQKVLDALQAAKEQLKS